MQKVGLIIKLNIEEDLGLWAAGARGVGMFTI